jgi:hypothetical protein
VGSDVPVDDNETFLVINFVNLKIKLTQYFRCDYRNRMDICMGGHICISICVFLFEKKRRRCEWRRFSVTRKQNQTNSRVPDRPCRRPLSIRGRQIPSSSPLYPHWLSWGSARPSRTEADLFFCSDFAFLCGGSVAPEKKHSMDLASVNEELAPVDGQIGDILRALQ